MKLEPCFADWVGTVDLNLDVKSYKERILELLPDFGECKYWNCNVITSLNRNGYNLLNDPVFSSLIATAADYVNGYAKLFGVENPRCAANDGWFNYSAKGSYQEYHYHPWNHISCVFYVEAPKDSGNLVFKSTNKNMFPLVIKEENLNQYSWNTIVYEPVVNRMIMFPSYLEHMVTMNKSEDSRISIAMNFEVKESDA